MNLCNLFKLTINSAISKSLPRQICTTSSLSDVFHMTRMRVVDNSPLGKQAMLEGKPPKVIGVYTKKLCRGKRVGKLGDRVKVAIKGQKKMGYIVGLRQNQDYLVPKFDSNNLVLIEDNGNPCGTRVVVPIPNYLRSKGPDLAKIIAIATKFV